MIKSILPILLFITSLNCLSQPYVNASFDANKVFHLKDNIRTIEDVYGLDYDLEVGIINNNIGLGVFYGVFVNAGFRNYGVMLDYYPDWFRWIDVSIGGGLNRTLENNNKSWYIVGRYALRSQAVIYFSESNNLGLSLKTQLTERIDTQKKYILEGSLGLTYKFNN